METHLSPGIGHNLPPTDAEILKDTLADKNKDILDRAQELIDAAERAPIAFEREERRQRIVQQHNCEQYGTSIAKWAEEKGLENPCDKTNQTEGLKP